MWCLSRWEGGSQVWGRDGWKPVAAGGPGGERVAKEIEVDWVYHQGAVEDSAGEAVCQEAVGQGL